LFGSEMLVFLVALISLSVVTRAGALFLLAASLLVAALLSRLWERYCLVGVEYRRSLGATTVPFGEEVPMDLQILNRKLLPLAWLEVADELPEGIKLRSGRVRPSSSPARVSLTFITALRPFERVRRRYLLHCVARGEHLFGPVRLRSGDLFGFVSVERTIENASCLVVYPRLVPLPDLGLPARQPLGDLRSRSWIFEDASRPSGPREYRPEDGLRRIHWPASVRTQRLQARTYDVTTSPRLAIFLNVNPPGEVDAPTVQGEVMVEAAISAAASIARWGLEQGCQVGLYCNGAHRGAPGPIVVESAADKGQLERILLALGRLQTVESVGFESLLAREARRLPFGSTLVVVAASLPTAAGEVMAGLEKDGHPVVVLLAKEVGGAGSPVGTALRRVSPQPGREAMGAIVP